MKNTKKLGDVYDDLSRGLNPTPSETKHFSEDTVNHPKHYKQYSPGQKHEENKLMKTNK